MSGISRENLKLVSSKIWCLKLNTKNTAVKAETIEETRKKEQAKRPRCTYRIGFENPVRKGSSWLVLSGGTSQFYLNNSLHFGLRGIHEHRNMCWGDVKLSKTADEVEYLEYAPINHEMHSQSCDFLYRCNY